MIFYMFTDMKTQSTDLMYWGDHTGEIIRDAFGVEPKDGGGGVARGGQPQEAAAAAAAGSAAGPPGGVTARKTDRLGSKI